MPLPQGVEKAIETVAHLDPAYGRQVIGPGVESGRPFDGHRLVGPKRRQHLDRKRRVGRHRPMVFQCLGGIVGRADQHDVHLPHDAAGRELGPGELRVALVPDAGRRGGIEQPIADPKRPLQFEMCPVIQRVAERLRDGLGPFLEFLPIRGVAGAVAFRHARGAHRPPLVMVAVQPDLREVLEAAIRGDVAGRKMAVIIDDRLLLGETMIQFGSAIVPQQEVVRNENVVHGSGFNKKTPPLAAKRNGGAGTEKRPMTLNIASLKFLSSSAARFSSFSLIAKTPRNLTRSRG